MDLPEARDRRVLKPLKHCRLAEQPVVVSPVVGYLGHAEPPESFRVLHEEGHSGGSSPQALDDLQAAFAEAVAAAGLQRVDFAAVVSGRPFLFDDIEKQKEVPGGSESLDRIRPSGRHDQLGESGINPVGHCGRIETAGTQQRRPELPHRASWLLTGQDEQRHRAEAEDV